MCEHALSKQECTQALVGYINHLRLDYIQVAEKYLNLNLRLLFFHRVTEG